eukprot:TRINITY_DN6177_c3_g1_i1.p1 TRINITY_DN6177_c3_g1~~TRINITY_DN6177_c3_g1_i1.p1  ORF type:complete len:400 (+),score=107.71 TRINITY_DN6177_c3_g1_i1:153-1352(+)
MAARSAALLCCVAACAGCRWTVFASADEWSEAAATIFLHSEHSLANQSHSDQFIPYATLSPRWDPHKNQFRNAKCNRDGWGVAWVDHLGAVSVRRRGGPATTKGVVSEELVEAVESVRSKVVFGHIRAATAGQHIDANSHPFLFDGGRTVWMHNGIVANHDAVKRDLLPKAAQAGVQPGGATDSEAVGAVFSWRLGEVRAAGKTGSAALEAAMRQTLWDVTSAGVGGGGGGGPPPPLFGPFTDCGAGRASSLNFAASDGRHLVATRLRTCDGDDPPTLYVGLPGIHSQARSPKCSFDSPSAGCVLARAPEGVTQTGHLWVSSEPLDRQQGLPARTWWLLPKDSMVTFDADRREVRVVCLSHECVQEPGSAGGVLKGIFVVLVVFVLAVGSGYGNRGRRR